MNCAICGKEAYCQVNVAPHAASGGSMEPRCDEHIHSAWVLISPGDTVISANAECPSCKTNCGGLDVYLYCPCCVRFIQNGDYADNPEGSAKKIRDALRSMLDHMGGTHECGICENARKALLP